MVDVNVDMQLAVLECNAAVFHQDGPPENRKTHIVFASDNESETEETSTHEQSCPEKELVKVRPSKH